MPGICGYIGADGSGAVPALADMIAPLLPHDWFVTEECELLAASRWETGLAAVSLKRANWQSHMARDSASDLCCVLDGEFYNRRELLLALPPAEKGRLGEQLTDAAILVAGFRSGGKAFLKTISGSFSALLWDAAAGRATIVTDRFGNRPLYYAASSVTGTSDRLLFSSRLKSLTAVGGATAAADPRGLAQFFSFGHYLGENTSLAGVKVLPAAACWTWDAKCGRWDRDTYHSWAEAYDLKYSSSADWIHAIGDAFGRAVASQTDDTPHLGLSLSGGLDARTILAAIDVRRTPLETVCLGIAGSLDHRCAQRLAEVAGCQNHSHVLDTQFLADYRRHLEWMVRLTDGQYLSQCIVMPTLPLYRKLGIEVLLRGHAGELMHMYKAYNYSLDEGSLAVGSVGQLEQWLFGRLSAYMLDGVKEPVFQGDLWNELGPLARQSLADDVAGTAAVEPPSQRIWQLFVTQRLRRETVLSLNEFRSIAETRLPILDNDLIALLLAAPPGIKLGEEIQQALLKRYRPEFLRVVNANTGTRVGAGPWARKFSSLKLRALAKLGLPGYQPYERLGLWLKRELRQMVRDILLDPQTLDRGLYRADGLRTVVENHQAGRANHTYLIMALMIFELGQRYLFADASAGEPQPRQPAGAMGGVR
jgi:asparagine synthase (glutamine-hydrolysing)